MYGLLVTSGRRGLAVHALTLLTVRTAGVSGEGPHQTLLTFLHAYIALYLHLMFVVFCFVLAAPCGMLDLGSLNRNRTCVPCFGSEES